MDGMDIYRDAMRSFIVRQLGQADTTDRKSAVIRALHPENRQYFERGLTRNRGNLEATIDINNFSWIIENNANWDQCFASVFGHKSSTRNQLRTIADSRNAVAHPDTGDLDTYHVISALTSITEVLDRIEANTQKTAVEQIREAIAQPNLAPQPAPESSPTHTVTIPEIEEPAPKPKPRTRTRSSSTLKPWWQVIEPHPGCYRRLILTIGICRRSGTGNHRQSVSRIRRPRRVLQSNLHYSRHPYPTGKRHQAH